MFHIPEGSTVFIAHAQTRMEAHGDERVPAIDVSLSWFAPAMTLDELCPGLTDVLFTATPPALAEGRAVEGTLPFEPDKAHEFVRFPGLKMPFGVLFESAGYTLVLRKLGQRHFVTLSNCKVGKIRLTPQDGAQVELTLLAQCSQGVDIGTAGTLDLWQQANAWCSMSVPSGDEDDAQAEIPEVATADDDEPGLP
jgi:hypothetical protein